ncbi:MAG: RNA polymerase-binding protein RbpA [Cumulibacter sp.]|uniref:RNA polymerase-binding protein RbpA n=1 Tax=Cumulibacter soli TaxID=2546344 RepID=UPI0010673BDF|nr:RNA polymerase-binding protein RbpA [Cumulibacter soli]
MAERTLRGSRLGSISYETDRNFEPVARVMARYECAQSHVTSVPFADDAETPLVWECRYCGAESKLIGGADPEPKKVKPPRTHWDMLLERRTIEDLEEVLAERLDVLSERRGEKQSSR